MRTIVTGQIGLDKKPYLQAVADIAGSQGEPLDIYHVGDMMYAEARDVSKGRILDLPISRLNSLRRAAFKDIIADSLRPDPAATRAGTGPGGGGGPKKNIIVNTHATFRWRHGLFSAFDFDQVRLLQPDLFICLVDNIETVHQRLHKDHVVDATLKDCMVWREEEQLATELMSQAIPGSQFAILSRGRHTDTRQTLFRLVCRPHMRKVYPSFPMSHVMDMPDVLAEIDRFRAELAKHFICFDPGDVDEKLLLERAIAAAREGKEFTDVLPHSFGGAKPTVASASPPMSPPNKSTVPSPSPPMSPPGKTTVRTREVLDIAGDIDGQIYMRDFKLIDQSDMIVSLVPELPGGVPGLSSGVERELQHAFEHTKEVYVVWKPKKTPSPFITETATKVFSTVDEALAHFESKGYFGEKNLFGH